MSRTRGITNITNGIKTFVFLAVLFAFTALAIAPSHAGAAALTSSDSADNSGAPRNGKLVLQVSFDSPSLSDYATVVVTDGMGNAVIKGLAYNGVENVFEIAEGIYRVEVSARGFMPFAEKVEIKHGEATGVNAQLMRSRPSITRFGR